MRKLPGLYGNIYLNSLELKSYRELSDLYLRLGEFGKAKQVLDTALVLAALTTSERVQLKNEITVFETRMADNPWMLPEPQTCHNTHKLPLNAIEGLYFSIHISQIVTQPNRNRFLSNSFYCGRYEACM
ncbi:hypothetical protein Pelo_19788 [Pelomyxa schiedti]|nr:hypothetical protein Pelo_19788 [Pelomyxa schiedti]